jgi:hypothetical protein
MIPKNKHGIAWVNRSYVAALYFNLGYYTIRIGLRCIQNLCHQPPLLGLDLPQELKMETTDSPGKQIIRANGIPRGCMSLPQGSPPHLLRQSWGPNRLLLDISRQSRWILKQRCNADIEVYAKEFDILCTWLNTWKHLCLMMVTSPE